MTNLLFFGVLGLLVVASLWDLRTREIPDWVSAAIVVFALLAAVGNLAGIRWWMVGTGGLLGLGLGAALFRWAKFGGGDAKLIAALGALLGPVGLCFALFWIALAGGLLAILAALRGQRDFAYGPAIAAGYFVYLVWPAQVIGRWGS